MIKLYHGSNTKTSSCAAMKVALSRYPDWLRNSSMARVLPSSISLEPNEHYNY